MKYKVNQDFFKTWSADMAYILGFITGDGSVSINKGYSLHITLNIKDIELLEFIKNKLSPDCNLYYRFQQCKKNISKQVGLRIYNKILVTDLIKFGVIPQKTGKEILPLIPEPFIYDYLRGLFDADGSIQTHNSKGYKSIRFCLSSKNFNYLENIQKRYFNNFGDIKVGKGCFDYIIYKKECIKNIIFHFYKYNQFSLKRKQEKLLSI